MSKSRNTGVIVCSARGEACSLITHDNVATAYEYFHKASTFLYRLIQTSWLSCNRRSPRRNSLNMLKIYLTGLTTLRMRIKTILSGLFTRRGGNSRLWPLTATGNLEGNYGYFIDTDMGTHALYD